MQMLLDDRDASLSGEDRFTSLLAHDQYIRALQWIEPLSEEEEIRYQNRVVCAIQEQAHPSPNQWRLMLARDARRVLFHGYLTLVSRIATRFWVRGGQRDDLMDLIQVGNMALLNALEECHLPEGRALFVAYLITCVRRALIDASYEGRTIRIPSSTISDAKKRGRDVESLNLCKTVSLEQRYQENDEEPSLLDTLEAPAFLLSPPAGCPPEKVHLLALLLAELPEREREIIRSRYGLREDGITSSREETAKVLGIQEATVAALECQALVRWQNLVKEYEQETGRTETRWLDGDEELSAYLERRRAEKAALPAATRVVNAQVHQAFTVMQEAGEPITSRKLAQRAGVCRETALQYLQTKRDYITQQASHKERQARLEQAFTAMQEAGEPINSKTLAYRAKVNPNTALKYLKTKQEYITRQHEPREERQARLEQAFTVMQEAGEPITSRKLAQRAEVTRSNAQRYLHELKTLQEA